MKTLFYSSLIAAGFGLFQTLSFIATAYPAARGGAILFLLLGVVAIFAVGFANWCGYKNQGLYFFDGSSLWLGFAPTIILGFMAMCAIAFGIHSGMG